MTTRSPIQPLPDETFEAGFRAWLETVEGAEAVEGVVRQAIGSWEEHAEAIARMAAMAEEMIAQAASAAAAMQRWWDQHGVELTDFLTALARFPQDHREVVAEYGAICTRLGWPPTMQFPWAFLAEFVKMAREGATDADLEAALAECWDAYFDDERIRDVSEGWWEWEEILGPRRPLLDQALRAHADGLYALSVPVFLSHIEGVLADAFAHHGWLRGHGVKDGLTPSYLRLLVEGADPTFGHGAVLEHAEKATFGEFKRGQVVRGLNRHAVLHGADVGYATRLRSLQALLAFDLIVGTLGWIDLGDGIAHRPGCPELARLRTLSPQPSIRVIRRWESERRDGLPECATCGLLAKPSS